MSFTGNKEFYCDRYKRTDSLFNRISIWDITGNEDKY